MVKHDCFLFPPGAAANSAGGFQFEFTAKGEICSFQMANTFQSFVFRVSQVSQVSRWLYPTPGLATEISAQPRFWGLCQRTMTLL